MKILAKPLWKAVRTCGKCKTEVSVNIGDLKVGRFGGVSWGNETGEERPYVECPTCDNCITFGWSKVPPKEAWKKRTGLKRNNQKNVPPPALSRSRRISFFYHPAYNSIFLAPPLAHSDAMSLP